MTEYNRTTAQDSTNMPTDRAIRAKYRRLRTGLYYPVTRSLPLSGVRRNRLRDGGSRPYGLERMPLGPLARAAHQRSC
jgi:hypothetical protein